MDLNIAAEWLLSRAGEEYDYEPSGLMTPRDRAELERRKAAHLSAASAAPVTDGANDSDEPAAAVAGS